MIFDMSSSTEYEVERVLDEQCINGKTMYKVKWVGYSMKENTWEPASNLSNAIQSLREWKNVKRRKQQEEAEMQHQNQVIQRIKHSKYTAKTKSICKQNRFGQDQAAKKQMGTKDASTKNEKKEVRKDAFSKSNKDRSSSALHEFTSKENETEENNNSSFHNEQKGPNFSITDSAQLLGGEDVCHLDQVSEQQHPEQVPIQSQLNHKFSLEYSQEFQPSYDQVKEQQQDSSFIFFKPLQKQDAFNSEPNEENALQKSKCDNIDKFIGQLSRDEAARNQQKLNESLENERNRLRLLPIPKKDKDYHKEDQKTEGQIKDQEQMSSKKVRKRHVKQITSVFMHRDTKYCKILLRDKNEKMIYYEDARKLYQNLLIKYFEKTCLQ